MPSLDDSVKWASVATPIVSFVVGLLTVGVLVNTIRLTKTLKSADLLAEFNRRFESLTDLKYQLLGSSSSSSVPTPDVKAEGFWRRYWSLQMDQYVAWKDGLISNDTFRHWLSRRHAEWHSNDKTLSISYQNGWQMFKPDADSMAFVAFVEKVHLEGPSANLLSAEKKVPTFNT